MKLEEKLVRLRRQSGLSQLNAAEKLGVSRQAISRWEVGASMPSTDNLKYLSEMYGVSVDYLLNDSLDEPENAGGKEQSALPIHKETVPVAAEAVTLAVPVKAETEQTPAGKSEFETVGTVEQKTEPASAGTELVMQVTVAVSRKWFLVLVSVLLVAVMALAGYIIALKQEPDKIRPIEDLNHESTTTWDESNTVFFQVTAGD